MSAIASGGLALPPNHLHLLCLSFLYFMLIFSKLMSICRTLECDVMELLWSLSSTLESCVAKGCPQQSPESGTDGSGGIWWASGSREGPQQIELSAGAIWQLQQLWSGADEVPLNSCLCLCSDCDCGWGALTRVDSDWCNASMISRRQQRLILSAITSITHQLVVVRHH